MNLGDRATVIYNADSGAGNGVGIEEIERCLRDQGLEPSVHEAESTSDLDAILSEASGLVVTCGGDGTFSAACAQLAGRDDVQIAHVALGTANNIAYSLGIPPHSIEALADLASRTPRRLNLGKVSQADKTARFVEGFGCGVFAELLHRYDTSLGKSPMRAFTTLIDVLPSFEPVTVKASVDGHDVSGEYLMFSVLNMKRIGPRSSSAPDADPFDGQFDIVGVKPDERDSLLGYAKASMAGDVAELDGVVLRRGCDVEIAPDDFIFHIDTDTFEASASNEDDSIHVTVDEHAVTVLIPDRCA
ncbi:MAG: diacylglycerol kinase family protein [Trueperaceae bacterium]|nr:diacylglycerol kinase family protein [Trueperaceae bacterium]